MHKYCGAERFKGWNARQAFWIWFFLLHRASWVTSVEWWYEKFWRAYEPGEQQHSEWSVEQLIAYEARTASRIVVIKSGNNYSLQYMRIGMIGTDSGCWESFYDIKKKPGVNNDQVMRQQKVRKSRRVLWLFFMSFYHLKRRPSSLYIHVLWVKIFKRQIDIACSLCFIEGDNVFWYDLLIHWVYWLVQCFVMNLFYVSQQSHHLSD